MDKLNNVVKLAATILIAITSLVANGQRKFIGKFSGFPGVLELKADSSYTYHWAYDLTSSWSVGYWLTNKDTLFLMNTPIYDTLCIVGTQLKEYKLVLSLDEFSESIDSASYEEALHSLGGQNRREPPSKLFLKGRRLYFIFNGKVVKGKAFDVIGQRYHKYSFRKL